MSLILVDMDEDRLMLKECLSGNTDALACLRNKHQPFLAQVLMRRGATAVEADDLLADLWSDCVATNEERLTLLEKYSGRCSVKTWLATVATNRLLDLKRRQKLKAGTPPKDRDGNPVDLSELVPTPPIALNESALSSLLRESVQRAFDQCPSATLLMLRLVHVHGLTQREVGRMWGWHESKVSRCLASGLDEIKTNILGCVRRTDPWIELTWQDFVDLCETHQIGFV